MGFNSAFKGLTQYFWSPGPNLGPEAGYSDVLNRERDGT